LCSEKERLLRANVMLACILGCDHLFEVGYIYVDCAGVIRRRAGLVATVDLDVWISNIEGLSCSAFSRASARYFAWHRDGWIM
jgi:hypothetical protein